MKSTGIRLFDEASRFFPQPGYSLSGMCAQVCNGFPAWYREEIKRLKENFSHEELIIIGCDYASLIRSRELLDRVTSLSAFQVGCIKIYATIAKAKEEN